ATARLHHVTTVDDVVRVVCPGAAEIAECDDVVFSELDGAQASPLGATGAFSRLPVPFRLPSGLVDPDNPRIPEVFAQGRYTAFRVEMDGRPAAVIHVGTTPPGPATDALVSFASLVGAALGCAALERRRHRQRNLLHTVWGRDDAAGYSTGPFPGPTRIPPTIAQQLTTREREILTHVLTGSSNVVIARELVISVETVRTHVKRVLRKCGVANRAEFIARFESDQQA
ncbi:MAG TPA: helix-turn-helix transcriptional regulator, partial [Aldersonia sp.]